jgi:hypothetical protein
MGVSGRLARSCVRYAWGLISCRRHVLVRLLRMAAVSPPRGEPAKRAFLRLCCASHKRKNWLFAGSEGGAEHAAILCSLVVSCKLAGVDPFAYFRDVLLRIHTHPAERLAELIPREWKVHFGPAAALQTQSAA